MTLGPNNFSMPMIAHPSYTDSGMSGLGKDIELPFEPLVFMDMGSLPTSMLIGAAAGAVWGKSAKKGEPVKGALKGAVVGGILGYIALPVIVGVAGALFFKHTQKTTLQGVTV